MPSRSHRRDAHRTLTPLLAGVALLALALGGCGSAGKAGSTQAAASGGSKTAATGGTTQAAAAPPPAPAVLVPVAPVRDASLPVAAVRNVDETFFGTTVSDPFRYFEDTKATDVAAWMKAHSDFAQATLKRIPGRARMLEAITRYDEAAAARVYQVVRAQGDRYFYEQRGVGENQFKLVMRQGLAGADKVLVDPEALEKQTGKPHAINWYSVSPDAKYVAYGLSQQGSEAADLYLLDVASGKLIGTPITRANFGGVDWSPDGKQFVFIRLQEMKKGMPADQKFQKAQVVKLAAGAPVARGQNIFGIGPKGLDIGPAETPYVTLSHDGKWAFGIVYNGTQRELALYMAPQAGVLAGRPQWKRVFDTDAEITGLTYFGNTLYLRSHKNAPRFQLMALDLAKPDIANARVIVPEGERVFTDLGAAADALYLEMRDGNIKRLYKMAYDKPGELQEVKLPVEGSFDLNPDEGTGSADPRLPGLVLDLQGWNRARQIYQVAADGSVSNTGLQPQGRFDAPPDVTVTEVKVKSHDGAMVPMSIIHKKGIRLDGRNPTLLYGYASYGITEEPFYSVSRLAWLDAGGVYAVANPRGTSVYGEDWYKAGFQTTKPNTWKDFIACAEYLVAQKYTAPTRLGILGGSAGGILVGRAMTERPDLFAAVIPAVGVLDAVRAEVTPNGVPNIPEFGTRKNEAGFRALLAMSTYHQVKDGTKYPAVLLTHGVNDPRVEVWHSTKTAARLLAASTSGRPVLLRLDYDAGHGIGNTKQQQFEERADMFSFLLWQMGVEGFQPQ